MDVYPSQQLDLSPVIKLGSATPQTDINAWMVFHRHPHAVWDQTNYRTHSIVLFEDDKILLRTFRDSGTNIQTSFVLLLHYSQISLDTGSQTASPFQSHRLWRCWGPSGTRRHRWRLLCLSCGTRFPRPRPQGHLTRREQFGLQPTHSDISDMQPVTLTSSR